MKVIKTMNEGRLVLTLRGDFDAGAAVPFRAFVGSLVKDGCVQIDVDLRLVKFMNTGAVTALLEARRLVEWHGGELRLVRLSDVAHWTLVTLGVDQQLLTQQRRAA